MASAIGILVQLTRGHLSLDLGVLGIPIYFGLLRRSSGWRTWALVFAWVGMLVSPAAFLLGLASRNPAYFKVFGLQLASLSPVWLSVVSVPFFFLNVWQYRVLTHPEIRASFL